MTLRISSTPRRMRRPSHDAMATVAVPFAPDPGRARAVHITRRKPTLESCPREVRR